MCLQFMLTMGLFPMYSHKSIMAKQNLVPINDIEPNRLFNIKL